jgi:ligand-binding sensor domain-containing protein/signal transduction histidine kinase
LFGRGIKYILFLFLITTFAGVLHSQSSNYFRRYEVEHGLTNNNVTCSAIDKSGFMWFGTRDGLNRFDGYTFKTFRNDPKDSSTIGNNSILSVEATGDMLLVGTEKGLYLYDPFKNIFRLVPSTGEHFVLHISSDGKNNIWAIVNRKLLNYNLASGKSKWYLTDKIRAGNLCTDDEGRLWTTSSGQLYQYDSRSDSFIPFNIITPDNKTGPGVFSIFNAGNGSLLLGTWRYGLLSLDIKTHQSGNLLADSFGVTRIMPWDFIKYSENEYWIGTSSGILVINLPEKKMTQLRMEVNNKFSISDNVINTLCRDREGGVWVGTRFGGINYYPYPYNLFNKYFSKAGTNSIQGNGVHEICPDKNGNLWIGTETAGLSKLNLGTQQFTPFPLHYKNETFSNPNIHGLLLEDNVLWIGTYDHGLFKLDLKTEKIIQRYSAGTGAFNTNFVVHLFRTKRGKLYAGTWSGLYEYDKSSDTFQKVPGFQFQTQSMLEDKQGIIWITTLGNGVFAINQQNNQLKRYQASREQDSLPSNMVNGQFEDSQGIHWFTTEEGLVKFDAQKGRFRTFGTSQGLPSNFLFKILEDKSRNLWISSTQGLVRFDPANEKIKVFTVADGLLDDQFNWNSAYKDPAGRMYFGSVKGMISFIPENFMINNRTPPVYITGIQAITRETGNTTPNLSFSTPAAFSEKIRLKYNQSNISIDFAALSYTSPEMNEYAYMLEGFDNHWTKLKTNRKAYFTQLPPGEYKFLVRGSNNSGIWNESGTKLVIQVMPPLWKTWWAYTLYSLFIAGVIYLFLRIYHNFMREKHQRAIELLEHQKEKELYQNKIEFFTAIAHEIRTPLTLIQGPMENIMAIVDKVPDVAKNLRVMEKNTERLLEISHQLLDFQKLESQHFKLTLEEANISRLLTEIHANFEPLMEQRHLKHIINIPDNSLTASIDIDAFEKIMNNLYGNAVKYSDSFIKTTLKYLSSGDLISIEITTDGAVIPKESHDKIFEPFFRVKENNHIPGTGIGLTISKALAELHGGTLKVITPFEKLNSFVLELPAHQKEKPA